LGAIGTDLFGGDRDRPLWGRRPRLIGAATALHAVPTEMRSINILLASEPALARLPRSPGVYERSGQERRPFGCIMVELTQASRERTLAIRGRLCYEAGLRAQPGLICVGRGASHQIHYHYCMKAISYAAGRATRLGREYATVDDDPVLVPVRGGRAVEFRKGWKGEAEFVGESVGFFKLAAGDIPLLVQETCARVAGPRRLDSVDEVLRARVKQNRFGYEEITGLSWTEIDYPHDIEFAETKVLPCLLEQEANPAALAAEQPRRALPSES